MKNFKPIIFILLMVFICSCGTNSSSDIEEKLSPVIDQKKEEPESGFFKTDSTVKPQGNDKEKQQPRQNTPLPKLDWDKKIIKTAALNLEVKDYGSFNAVLRNKVKEFGGYIAQEEQSQSDYKIENILTIKVPVDQFDDAVNGLSNGVKNIFEKKITSQDVTMEVVDTKSRLEAKKEVRLRYLDLLKQARNMQDILNVQSEINGIQEEIEAAAGRIEYLSHSSSFSTIHLTYFQVLNASAKNYDHNSFGSKLSEAFKNGWSWVGDVFVGLISIWPLFILGFGCWLVYKKWQSRKVQKLNT